MLKDRSELEKALSVVLDEYRVEKEMIDEVKNLLFNKNIYHAMKLLSKQTPLSTQPDVILYYVAKYLHEKTGSEIINPEHYFTSIVIERFAGFEMENIQKKMDVIVFEDFIEVADDIWMGHLDIKKIADLWRYGIASYNTETQRNTIITKFHGSIIEEINLNTKAVSDIATLIKNNDFIPVSPIIFNILRTGDEKFEYEKNKQQLTYYEGSLNCTDGFHRSQGILSALLDNPYIDLEFPLMITNFTKEKARQMIGQEQNRNAMKKEYSESLKDTLENYIISELNSRSGEIKNKIATDMNYIRHNMAYTLNSVMNIAIQENFKYENKRDARRVVDFLVEGFDEIIGVFYDDFKNLTFTKQNSVKAHVLTFAGYVSLLGELYGKDNWQNKLENALNKINFDINNELWNKLGIFNENRITKRGIKKISKYFKELV